MPTNDFGYESGMNRIKEINTNIKTLGDRSTWLVGFLIAITAALASSIFGESQVQTENPVIALFIIHSSIIFFMLAGIIIPSFGALAYGEPKSLTQGGNKSEKIMEKENQRLQIQAEKNKKHFDKLNFRLKFSIAILFASLLYVAVKLF